MVAADYLVSFLCENTVLGFCDLINKNNQRSTFLSEVGGRNYNICKSLSSKCVGSIYHVISHTTVEDSRQYFLLSTVIYH